MIQISFEIKMHPDENQAKNNWFELKKREIEKGKL